MALMVLGVGGVDSLVRWTLLMVCYWCVGGVDGVGGNCGERKMIKSREEVLVNLGKENM